MVKYKGTKVSISANLYPKGYKHEVIEIDSKPYDMVQKTSISIDRAKVIKATELETFNELINKLGDEVETKLKADFDDRNNFESFAIVKFIDSNLKGKNAFKNVEPSYLMSVEIHIRKEEPKPIVKKPTKEEIKKAVKETKTPTKPKKVAQKKDVTK